jgi:hypothetical protein
MSEKSPPRTTIDLSDLKEKIESYSSSPAWRELSLGGKCRSLMVELLELREAEKAKAQQLASNSSAHGKADLFIKSLVGRGNIDLLTLQQLADELAIPSPQLASILKDCCIGKEKSGAKN